ncbi:MAG: T9SS type A sorting domain-containing protein [Saprospiraceae bacterium]|nr:T9SS type A sorting domain-containing protein [Saprospiraceae bacterium]
MVDQNLATGDVNVNPGKAYPKLNFHTNYDVQFSNDFLSVSGNTSLSIFQLFNASGQLLQNIKSDQAEVEISLSNQNVGFYFLKIVNMENGKVSTLRFVKGD